MSRLVVFDCDGTLVDGQAAICETMELAFTSNGLAAPDRHHVRRMVGLSLPYALRRKYPNAARSLEWQWLFPSQGLCTDDEGNIVRHNLHVSAVQKAVRRAVRATATGKPAGCHTFAAGTCRCAYYADLYPCPW